MPETMKKIVLYITLILSVSGLQSCLDDFLTQLPYSTSTPETFTPMSAP